MRFLSVNNWASYGRRNTAQSAWLAEPGKDRERGVFLVTPLVPIIADDILHNLGITSLDSPGALVTKTTVSPRILVGAETFKLFPNSSSPCAGLVTLILDELFESDKIALHPTRNNPERAAGFVDETFGVIHELKFNASTIWTDRRKVYSTRGIFPSFALPGDEMVGNLIRDSSVPFFNFAPYLRFPVQSLII